MNNENNYGSKGYGCVVFVAAFVSVLFSCAALLRWDNWECEISPAGFVIGVLSALITFLVGWQIFSLINIKQIEDRIKESENQLHKHLGEICGDISASQTGIDAMAHISVLFTIHALIHYSKIGDFSQCEREINALDEEMNIISTHDVELRDMFHRMTGRIAHPEKIPNFGKLLEIINNLFTPLEFQPQ